MSRQLPQAAAARTRDMVKLLRDVKPPAPDWQAERAARKAAKTPARKVSTPGVRVVHVLGDPPMWTVQAMDDKQPYGDPVTVHDKGALWDAAQAAIADATKRIEDSGRAVSDNVDCRKVVAIRSGDSAAGLAL